MSTKILFVDDEVDLQELVKRKFRRELRHGEFTFEFANDGVEALEKVQEDQDIDLVITDINMPRMDGLSLLEHLTEFEDRLKTIIISAYGDMDNIRTAMNRGASDFVTKPIDFHDLLITIKNSLDQLDVLKEAIEHRLAAERARGNLARYFPPALAEALANRDEPFGPPRQQNIGVLFVDIRGFTTFSEEMSPASVMELLRGFHSRMEAAIFDHDGTLENYIADEVVATFGVPDNGPRDATNTLACARAMHERMEQWNRERASNNEPPIKVGIGAHFGQAVMGDTGSERAMAFTVIGDTVNTASRLQGLTRSLESDLVVSRKLIYRVREEAAAEAQSLLEELVDVGAHEVRGRAEKVQIYSWLRS